MAIITSSSITLVRVNDGADGVTAWTTTVAPVTPNYTFTKTNLNGAAGHTPKVGDLIFYRYYRYRISTVASTTVLATDRVSIRGAAGAAGAAGTDGQSAYEAAVAGGYTGTQTQFYTDLGLMQDLPAVYSTVQTHDGQLTSHGAIFTAMNVTVDGNGQVLGVSKTYSELTAEQLKIESHLETGGVNLVNNATFGSQLVPDSDFWANFATTGHLLARFEGMTTNEVMAVIGAKTFAQITAFDW